MDGWPDSEQGHPFARVVGRWGRWVVAVVSGNEKQVVLFEWGDERGQRAVEFAERLIEPLSIVLVPVQLFEILYVGKQEPTIVPPEPRTNGVDSLSVRRGVP